MKLVDVVALSVDTGLVKPELSAYSDVLKMLKVSANEAMFVGDGKNRELAAAKSSGFARVIFLRQFVAHYTDMNAFAPSYIPLLRAPRKKEG